MCWKVLECKPDHFNPDSESDSLGGCPTLIYIHYPQIKLLYLGLTVIMDEASPITELPTLLITVISRRWTRCVARPARSARSVQHPRTGCTWLSPDFLGDWAKMSKWQWGMLLLGKSCAARWTVARAQAGRGYQWWLSACSCPSLAQTPVAANWDISRLQHAPLIYTSEPWSSWKAFISSRTCSRGTCVAISWCRLLTRQFEKKCLCRE